jgi:uncharacterized protein
MTRMLMALALEFSLAAGAVEQGGETPLMTAAYHGDVKAMRALLDRGAKADEKTQSGMTALYYACGATPIVDQVHRGSPEAVRLLLDHGADPNVAAVRTGHTPLMTAVDNDSLEDVKLLLAHGAAVNARDTYGASALTDALARRRWPIAAFLVEQGADVNAAPDVNGKTPLMIAIQAVPPLSSVPADGSDPSAGKALLDAVAIVKSLLDHKAEVNPLRTNGQTPLTLAATQCHALVVRDLLAHGAEVNARSKTMAGATALILAADCGNLPMAQALLAKGADVNLRDNLRRTALDLAEKNQQGPMIELLEKAGAKAVDGGR